MEMIDGISAVRAQGKPEQPTRIDRTVPGRDEAKRVAREFEALLLSQTFESMFRGVGTDGLMGGGHAEKTWRSLLLMEYGRAMAESGGVGIADRVYRDILRMEGMGTPAKAATSQGDPQ